MTNKDLKVFKKTSKVWELRFTRNNIAIDVHDWYIYFTVKENVKDTDDNAKIKIDAINTGDYAQGKILVELTTTHTDQPAKSYYYDMKYKDTDGNADIIMSGRITFEEPITQRG